MANHSLKPMVVLIGQRYCIKIKTHHLWHVYQRDKARSVKPEFLNSRKEVKKDYFLDEQQRLSKEIAHSMARNRHLIYFDKRSFQ